MLLSLSTKKSQIIDSVYLLGGAVGRAGTKNEDNWGQAARAVSGKVHNCYSRNDRILKFLYRGASGMRSVPIGTHPILSNSRRIKNWDFSDIVTGHNQWKLVLPEVLARIGTEKLVH
jgi:Protein of unknown function (DUF726)